MLPHTLELNEHEITSKEKALEQRYPKIEQQYPKIEQQPKQIGVFPDYLASMAEAMAKLNVSLGNTLLPEDIERYNTELDKFYQAYFEYLRRDVWYENLRRRTVKLPIYVANDGTAPAEDVDVFMHFPDGFKLTDEQGLPSVSRPPDPPAKPKTQMQRALESINGSLVSIPPLASYIPDAILSLSQQNVSSPNIRQTGSYDVDFHVQRIKHKLQEPADPLYVIFESFESARSFQIDYRLLAANVPNEVTGQLHVIIKKD